MLLKSLLIFFAVSNPPMCPCKPKFQPFSELRNSKFFVDKTLFIRDFLSGTGVVSLLRQTRRGFGKTSNLDMIRRYAEIDVNPDGTMKTDQKTHKNYHMFADIVPSSGEHLAIFKLKYIFEKHFGQHPVIWLDLNTSQHRSYNDVEFMRLLLNNTIRAAFEDHAYLQWSKEISPRDKWLLNRFLYPNVLLNDEFIRAYPPRTGIILLKRLLHQHFNRAPVALVDNVDAPLQEIILDSQQNTDEALEKLYTLGGIIDAVVGAALDTAVQAEPPRRTLMTGALEPNHIFELNTNFSSSKFGGFDGISEETVKSLIDPKKLETFTSWYCGYWEVCNLYSVLSYLTDDEPVFKPYWTELGSLESFRNAFVAECFGQRMMECFRLCELPVGWKFSFGAPMLPEDVRKLKYLQQLNLPIQSSQCTGNDLDPFVEVLHRFGYLTITGMTHRPREDWVDASQFLTFRVPNLEVQHYLSALLLEATISETRLNGNEEFRVKLFEAIIGVDGTEVTMRRFADTLVTLHVALERRGKTGDVATSLAHSVRVHLLNPPPSFRVKYVKTGRSEKELDERKAAPDFDVVFVMASDWSRDLAFVMKIESAGEVEPTGKLISTTYLDAFTTEELISVTDNATKVMVNLMCGKEVCTITYVFNDENLEREKQLEISKELVAVKAKGRWGKRWK